MESMVDIVKAHARNVKRWQTGDMRLRWAAAGMLCAEAQYRRVNGYRQLDRLASCRQNTSATLTDEQVFQVLSAISPV